MMLFCKIFSSLLLFMFVSNLVRGDEEPGPGQTNFRSSDNPPEPDHRRLSSPYNPPEPDQRRFNTPYNPPEPDNRNLNPILNDEPEPNNKDHSQPIEPGQTSFAPYDHENRFSSTTTDEILITNRRLNSPSTDRILPPDPYRRLSSPSTDGILPPDPYRRLSSPSTDGILPPGTDRRLSSPSTDRILPPETNRRLSSPSTDGIVSPIPYNPPEPGRNNFDGQNDDPNPIRPIGPGRTRFTPNLNIPEPGRNRYWDSSREYWNCNFGNSRCRLENRVNFVPFNPEYYLDSPALVLDIGKAAQERNSLTRLNPVKSYNAARLVTSEYFPVQNQPVACLNFVYAWSGYSSKHLHILQRNKEDKCIYAAHQTSTNDLGQQWRDIQLQLNLNNGDSTFLIEFSFETPVDDRNDYSRLGKIAIRDFKIGYGYCQHDQSFECDLPLK